jgi:hypothetical protein
MAITEQRATLDWAALLVGAVHRCAERLGVAPEEVAMWLAYGATHACSWVDLEALREIIGHAAQAARVEFGAEDAAVRQEVAGDDG